MKKETHIYKTGSNILFWTAIIGFFATIWFTKWHISLKILLTSILLLILSLPFNYKNTKGSDE